MQQDTGRQGGFTLVEVMAVVAVSGLLLVGMWRLYHGSIRAYRRGLQDVQVTQGARIVLRFLTRDLQRAFATALPYGIRGVDHTGSGADADRLELRVITYSTGATGQGGMGKGAGIPQRIRYLLEPRAEGNTRVLKRVSAGMAGGMTQRVMPLSERLYGLNLRYFDGQAWYDAWQQVSLPRAVELTIELRSRGWYGRTHRFTTVVTPD